MTPDPHRLVTCSEPTAANLAYLKTVPKDAMNSLTITVPIPDKALHPNSRVHWAQKAKATKLSRDRGHAAAVIGMVDVGMNGPRGPKWPAASVRATFYVKDKRGMSADIDGRISSLKATMDGIADAGVVVNDRVLTWRAVEHRIDKANPRVELTITPLTEEKEA